MMSPEKEARIRELAFDIADLTVAMATEIKCNAMLATTGAQLSRLRIKIRRAAACILGELELSDEIGSTNEDHK